MTTEETPMTDPGYRLFLDADHTILLRIWDTGEVELTTRPHTGAVWGPPVELEEVS
jgi:hypothetical protein